MIVQRQIQTFLYRKHAGNSSPTSDRDEHRMFFKLPYIENISQNLKNIKTFLGKKQDWQKPCFFKRKKKKKKKTRPNWF